MRPIPVSLLIHSAALYDVEKDDYRQETDTLRARLDRVRVDPSVEIVKDRNGEDVQCSALLFYDERNSLPRGLRFSTGQAVVFDGQRYRVQDVQMLYDERALHHQEVALIDG